MLSRNGIQSSAAMPTAALAERALAMTTRRRIDCLRVSEDGRTLAIADGFEGTVLDTAKGTARGIRRGRTEGVSFLPGGEQATLEYRAKWQIELDPGERAVDAGCPSGLVLADLNDVDPLPEPTAKGLVGRGRAGALEEQLAPAQLFIGRRKRALHPVQ